jgi:cytochrome c-type biogenesis protein CcmH/NrfG
VLALKPGYVEAEYVQALADVQLGDTTEAISLLQSVLKANPNHPRANLALARLYTEQGDLGAAAACLAAHARVYGGV